jgi:K+-transporting ATPase A subunit
MPVTPSKKINKMESKLDKILENIILWVLLPLCVIVGVWAILIGLKII